MIYWTPIIAPGNFIFYNGAMVSQRRGSALMGGMATQRCRDQNLVIRRFVGAAGGAIAPETGIAPFW